MKWQGKGMETDGDTLLLVTFAWLLVMGAVGAAVGMHRNRFTAGLIWGVILGPLGWFLVWIGPTAKPTRARPRNW
jgi:hypothetical protein